jgi:predicted glycosyltransferase
LEEAAHMTWGEMGQLMSGAGVLMTSLCAGVTVTIISLYQKRRQWVDDFRTLYAEFWNDKDISQVRRWIVSNMLYNEVLKPVLTQRIEKGYNDLDEDGSMKIDMIDKFMSLIVQLETLEESTRTQRQRTLVKRFLFSKHWGSCVISVC